MTTELIKLTLEFRGLSDEPKDDGNLDIDGDDLGDPELTPGESEDEETEEEEGAM